MAESGAYTPAVPTIAFAGAGATVEQTSGTSLGLTGPTGVADGDMLVAVIMARYAITPPSGWTVKKSITFSSTTYAITQYLAVYTKDTVTSADSGGSFTFTAAGSGRFIGAIARVTCDQGNASLYADVDVTYSDATEGLNMPISAMTAARGTELCIMASSTIASSSSVVTAPTGMSLWAGSGIQRFKCWQADYTTGESTPTTVSAESTDIANNGCGALAIMIRGSRFETLEEDNVNVILTDSQAGSTYNPSLADGVSVWSHGLYGTLTEAALADETVITDAATYISALGVSVTETISVAPTSTGKHRVARAVADGVDITDTLSALWGVTHRDTVTLTDTRVTSSTFNLAVSNAMAVADSIAAGKGASLADTVEVSETLAFLIGASVLERLGLAETVLPGTTFGVSVTQAMRLTDVLGRFFGMGASDTMTMTAATTTAARYNTSGTETVEISDTETATLVLRALVDETVELTATDALKLAYTATLTDTAQIGAAYIAPNGSVTTWAINTRNRAVTEYGNYDFNSFARIGHKYIAGNSTGLYELDGNDDDGTSIIAKIRGGQLQIAGSRFSSFKAAYIGMHGTSGEVILRLESGGGQSYTYTVTAKDDRTTRVRLGKGLRARYFVYELETTGQDFDLDSIEFIPIMAERRD